MKRIIALILMLTLAVFCLASCTNISKYEDKLEDEDYETDTIKEKEVKAMLKQFKLDIDDYKIKEAIEAMNEDGDEVTIFQCGSAGKAKSLAEDLEKAFKKNDIDGIKIDTKGKFVFVGDKSAIKDAQK